MRAKTFKTKLAHVITFAFLLSSQACELLQKRDIEITETTEKETRNFSLLTYIFIEELALTDTIDPERILRNNFSSINAAMMVASKESSFKVWHEPAARCLKLNEGDLKLQRVRANINMGDLRLLSESTLQEAFLTPQETSIGPAYGAGGWLPPSLYTFEFFTPPALAWTETAVPTLAPGSGITLWSNGAWLESASPEVNFDENIVIRKSEDFKVQYRNPDNSTHTVLLVVDRKGNTLTCYGAANSEITVPQEYLADLQVGAEARIEVKFVNTRLNTEHAKINEIFIQSTSRHVIGKLQIGENEAANFGFVSIVDP